MANICNNKFYLCKQTSEADYEKSLANLKKFLDPKHSDFDEDDVFIEGWFESRWSFPIDIFENIIVGDVYFRCLSEEYGLGYVAMNIYDEGWQSEQTFDL